MENKNLGMKMDKNEEKKIVKITNKRENKNIGLKTDKNEEKKIMKMTNISSWTFTSILAKSAPGSRMRASSGCEYIRSHKSRCCSVNRMRFPTRRARASSRDATPIKKSPAASMAV